MTNKISVVDVKNVAQRLEMYITDDQINEILLNFDAEAEVDTTATWDLIVENMLYQIKQSEPKLTLELTNFSKNNLQVIQNFLLYIQKEDEYGQAAINYITEDHVDGEGSEEALLERALGSELILDDIYLAEDEEEISYDVFANAETKLIYAVSNVDKEVKLFKLTKPQDEIVKEYRDEILSSRLSKYTDADEVSLGDIFMYGKFVKRTY